MLSWGPQGWEEEEEEDRLFKANAVMDEDAEGSRQTQLALEKAL